jgi:hypothetical protein
VFFRCEKNVPDDFVTDTSSRFSAPVMMDNLVPVTAQRLEEERQKMAQREQPEPPPPADASSPEVIKWLKEYDAKVATAEQKANELVQTEAGRLKLLNSLGNKASMDEYKNIARNTLETYYRTNRKKQISAAESEKLQEVLKSHDTQERLRAIVLFNFAKISNAPRILEEAFETETNPTNKEAIVGALSTVGDKQTIRFLGRIQSNEKQDATIRSKARSASTKIEVNLQFRNVE